MLSKWGLMDCIRCGSHHTNLLYHVNGISWALYFFLNIADGLTHNTCNFYWMTFNQNQCVSQYVLYKFTSWFSEKNTWPLHRLTESLPWEWCVKEGKSLWERGRDIRALCLIVDRENRWRRALPSAASSAPQQINWHVCARLTVKLQTQGFSYWARASEQ